MLPAPCSRWRPAVLIGALPLAACAEQPRKSNAEGMTARAVSGWDTQLDTLFDGRSIIKLWYAHKSLLNKGSLQHLVTDGLVEQDGIGGVRR